MLVRIVRMIFQEEKVSDFQAFFDAKKATIASFPGCEKVELLKDASLPNVFYTLSHWSRETDLENYRSSAFFKETWTHTKTLFAGKPEAYSLIAP